MIKKIIKEYPTISINTGLEQFIHDNLTRTENLVKKFHSEEKIGSITITPHKIFFEIYLEKND